MTCFDTAFNDTENGLAISVTVAGPRRSRAKIARRVGSEIAPKMRSSGEDLYSTIRLNYMRRDTSVNPIVRNTPRRGESAPLPGPPAAAFLPPHD